MKLEMDGETGFTLRIIALCVTFAVVVVGLCSIAWFR